jgi:hypothetical protein
MGYFKIDKVKDALNRSAWFNIHNKTLSHRPNSFYPQLRRITHFRTIMSTPKPKVARQVDDTIPLGHSKRTLFDFEDFDHSSIPFEKETWPVIIIGSSMVGMTLGVLLGFHG